MALRFDHAGMAGHIALCAALGLACSALAQAAEGHGPPLVSPAVHHDYLPSLRAAVPPPQPLLRAPRVRRVLPIPLPAQAAPAAETAAVQSASFGAAPTLGGSVDGVGEGFVGPQGAFNVQYAPPDTIGAAGATQYVQVVNVGFAVFDKASKSVVYGPVPTNTLWAGFGGPCESDNDGDAVVIYDKAAGRWVISQFAVESQPYMQCVAVSAGSDATGAYYRYAFAYGNAFPDYPKLGAWPDAYYITFNMFTNGQTFAGSRLCAYDRDAMLNNQPATQQCFQLSTSFGGVLPADLDGTTPPPVGAPNYLMNFGSNSLNLWRFHVDWGTPANTTLNGPINLPVAAFQPACGGGACVPQSGTRQRLDSLGDRLMYRLAYRNFGDHESLVVNHSVTVGRGRNGATGVRWYEVRDPGGTPTVFQQSTFAPDGDYRWMGSIAMDKLGDIALGYSVSSKNLFPAIRYTGRLAADPPNTLQAEASIIEGGGSQNGNLDRWGDYSGMSVDPVDDCTFWYTTEYLKSTGSFNWSTRIASVKFAGCN